MPSLTEPSDDTPLSTAEIVAWAALFATLTASRFAVAPTDLFEWDSANYALAMVDYDVYQHQPHAPGYPLFALGLKAFGTVLPTWAAFVALNTLLSCLLIAELGWMARPSLGARGAWLLGLCAVCCPIFWLHGSVSTAYVAECFCAVTVGALGLAVLRGRLRLEVAALGWALCLGLRPNGALTLSTLMALVTWWHVRAHGLESGLRASAMGMVVCLGWSSVMVAESGGLTAFRDATSALSAWQFKAGSALSDGPAMALRNGESLLTYSLDALNVAVFILVVPMLTRTGSRPAARTALFFAAWCLPSSAYYIVHHLPKSGYALTILPALALALAMVGRSAPRASTAIATVYALLNTSLFFAATPRGAYVYGDAPELVPDEVLMLGDYSSDGLRYATRPQRVLGEVLDRANPETDAVLFLSGAHELHRLTMATHGEFALYASFVERGWLWSTRHEESYGDWQLRVLRAPRISSTDLHPTTVEWDGHTVALSRREDQLTAPLPAKRLLVVIPCAPCILSNPGPGVAFQRVDLGAGFTATWFSVAESGHSGL